MKKVLGLMLVAALGSTLGGCIVVGGGTGSCFGAPNCAYSGKPCSSSSDCCGSGLCTGGFCNSASVLGSGCSCNSSLQCSGALLCTGGRCN